VHLPDDTCCLCRVLREDGLISSTGGLDWFEGAIAHPERVLTDLNTALGAPTSQVDPCPCS